MGQKRHKISDEQWEQSKDMIWHSKMGRPPKDDRFDAECYFLNRTQRSQMERSSRTLRFL